MGCAFGRGYAPISPIGSIDYHNRRVAATIASLLGIKFEPKHGGAGKAIRF